MGEGGARAPCAPPLDPPLILVELKNPTNKYTIIKKILNLKKEVGIFIHSMICSAVPK